MDFKKLKNEKGITLIALAVTIVVLLILAGVTIGSVFSENGIIKKAQKAENAIEKAKYNDLSEIAELEKQINEYTGATINEEEYATLNLNTYFGKHHRQKCDYLRMYVELSNKDDENEKVTFAIGTDWQDNINVESKDKLFYTKNVDMKLVQDLNTDDSYKWDNSYMEEVSLAGFSNVIISNLKIKKGNAYNIKLLIQGAEYKDNSVVVKMVEAYTGETEQIANDIVDIKIQKSDIKNWVNIYDILGDGAVMGADATALGNIVKSNPLDADKYTIRALTGDDYDVIYLLNEEGDPINSDYVGFDINRDGYICCHDARIINKFCAGTSSEW